MSLWTPDGEHRVPRNDPSGAGQGAAGADTDEPVVLGGLGDEDPFAGLTPEEAEQAKAMAAEMAEVRRQLSEVPADVIVANHVMGLYELAAIHLTQQPPSLSDARLAIDAMGLVIGGLEGRLGEAEPTLRDALTQIRMAFVQVQTGAGDAPG